MITIDQIKKLRQETGISISECKKALEEGQGDISKAKEFLRKLGRDLAFQKKEKKVKAGLVESYIHPGKKLGVIIELHCESDFVAKNPDFQKLAHELCLQIVAIGEEPPLLKQAWIRDERKTIKDLIEEYIAKLGENIIIKRFTRYEI